MSLSPVPLMTRRIRRSTLMTRRVIRSIYLQLKYPPVDDVEKELRESTDGGHWSSLGNGTRSVPPSHIENVRCGLMWMGLDE
ncbi:hypothetical protein TNCV_3304271 [Trichonephila clavipes]|nr:hypothetical protein TNCV_3304271 [Trichonephila clavipes]